MDAKRILKGIEDRKNDRGRVTLYLSKSLFEKFKTKCEAKGVASSVVIEEMMVDFLNSLKKKR